MAKIPDFPDNNLPTHDAINIPDVLPVMALRDAVLFPFAIIPLTVGRDISVRAWRSGVDASVRTAANDSQPMSGLTNSRQPSLNATGGGRASIVKSFSPVYSVRAKSGRFPGAIS